MYSLRIPLGCPSDHDICDLTSLTLSWFVAPEVNNASNFFLYENRVMIAFDARLLFWSFETQYNQSVRGLRSFFPVVKRTQNVWGKRAPNRQSLM